jgi:CRP-like cAMP-binding protein
MSGRDAFKPWPETCFTSEDRKHALPAQRVFTPNRLLAALPAEDYERLLPCLEPVALPLGWTIHRAGDRENYLYFITSGIVSRFYVMENGATARLAVTGSEGVIGVASFLGGESMPGQAVVLSPGYAYRLGAEVLKSEIARNSPLCQVLLRYVMALIAQTAQIAVCNRHHTIEQQLCRWLLLSLDRLPGNDVPMTHELISSMLGVRRESITDAAGKLQRAGLIHYSRGHIAVLDRQQLEAQACECYAVVKREYDRLFPIEDTIGNAGAHAFAAHNMGSIARSKCRRPSVPGAPVSIRPSTSGARKHSTAGDAQVRSGAVLA